MFDNPEIPPNYGYDLEFQKVRFTEFDDPEVRSALRARERSNPTPYLYELARRIAPYDPVKAIKTYLIAAMRMSYDANRCADKSALHASQAWDISVIPELLFLFKDRKLTKKVSQVALEEEALFPSDTVPWWVCRSGIAAMSDAIEGKVGPLKLIPVSEWAAQRERSREFIRSFSTSRR